MTTKFSQAVKQERRNNEEDRKEDLLEAAAGVYSLWPLEPDMQAAVNEFMHDKFIDETYYTKVNEIIIKLALGQGYTTEDVSEVLSFSDIKEVVKQQLVNRPVDDTNY